MIWKILGGAIGGIVGGVIKGLFGWIADRQKRADQLELGAKRQREATDQAVQKRVEEADEVERRVDAAGDAERERLRAKWTRPGG